MERSEERKREVRNEKIVTFAIFAIFVILILASKAVQHFIDLHL